MTRDDIKSIIKGTSGKAMTYGFNQGNTKDNRELSKVSVQCLMEALVELELVNDYRVICDESNNDDEVIRMEKFALDVYFKFKPTGKWLKHEGLAEKKQFVFPGVDHGKDLDLLGNEIEVKDTIVEFRKKEDLH